MLGAAIGDIVGSRFELVNCKQTDFELFTAESDFTDDTICTAAVAEWVLKGCGDDLAHIMQSWCRRYPHPKGAYGARFGRWIYQYPVPYNSLGNGSAMRVSAVGWAFDNLADTLEYAKRSAEITHNHPEGIAGAQATAAAIFWARTGKDKAFIRAQISTQFAYDLNTTCDELRPVYCYSEHCAKTVPPALIAFFDSENFEHAIRLAVSLGGDSDTLTAITGSIAEAFYGDIPDWIQQYALQIMPAEIADVLLQCKTP